jgi:hypothetical protein
VAIRLQYDTMLTAEQSNISAKIHPPNCDRKTNKQAIKITNKNGM